MSQSISVYLDDDGGKKQSIYSMAFPVTGDLNGQTKVLKVPVVIFSIKFVDKKNQPIPHYEFKILYRDRQSAIKKASSQGISTIRALAGQKLTLIDGQGRAQTTAIATYGSKQWTMIIGTNITEEDISDASDILNQDTSTTPETSEQEDTPKPQTKQDPVIKVEKPKVKEVEKKTEAGPTLEVASDEARITIKFVDESTNKPLSRLSYITQSTKYGKNTSVTGNDGTRGRTHDSLVGVDITVLVYEDGKEVEKGVITASADRNDIPYIYKAKKSKAKWHNPLSRMELRGWYSDTQWTPNKSDYKGRTGGKHDGLDLYAPEGTTLFACVSGIVYEYYTSSTYGHVIGIKGDYNGKTYYFFYAYLSERLFKRNEEVTAGNPIGKTGNVEKKLTKGHHLHFEVRTTPNRVGGRINPYTIKELKTINKSPSKSSQR